MWHAAILVPTENGERPAPGPGEAPQRKLRPIAQCDALIKVIESAMVEEEIHKLRTYLEPRQLGIATPDGPVLAVLLLRGWFEALEDEAAESGAGENRAAGTIFQLDLTNVYGRFFRAGALRAAEEASPILAMLAACQWRTGTSRAWVRGERSSWQKAQLHAGVLAGLATGTGHICSRARGRFGRAPGRGRPLRRGR